MGRAFQLPQTDELGGSSLGRRPSWAEGAEPSSSSASSVLPNVLLGMAGATAGVAALAVGVEGYRRIVAARLRGMRARELAELDAWARELGDEALEWALAESEEFGLADLKRAVESEQVRRIGIKRAAEQRRQARMIGTWGGGVADPLYSWVYESVDLPNGESYIKAEGGELALVYREGVPDPSRSREQANPLRQAQRSAGALPDCKAVVGSLNRRLH